MFFKSLVRLTFSLIITIIFFFPIYFWILISIKKDKDIYSLPPKLFSFELDFSSYEKMFGLSRFFIDTSSINFIGNDIYQIARFVDTLIISLGSTILVIIISVISAYSLSRMKIKFKEYFLLFIISTRIIPPISIAIPLYLMYKNLLILDTHLGIILAHTLMNLPLAVLLMKSFFDDIPKDIDEAAVMDGASQFYVFWRLIMPLTIGGIAATAVLCFIFSWTEFIFVLILTQTNIKTITVTSLTLGSNWSDIATIGTIAIIPTFIIIFLAQKNLVRGLTLGTNYK